jgi:hypothetical protein
MTSQQARRFCWFASVLGLLLLAVGAAWTISYLTADPGNRLENMFAQVRIGMSMDEAIAAVSHDADCMYIEGKTRSGRSFDSLVVFHENLPIPQEVQHGVLSVGEGTGDYLDIILGPGGVVTGKRFDPYSWGDLWLHRLHQVFGHGCLHGDHR